MYEEFYGFSESPFSLTPDPKFFFFGESHIRAYELLRYGIYRGEGFMILTGDIGTGKTTLWRMALEKMEENLYTAVLLNPFLSESDLLISILQDFGVISRAPANSPSISRHDMLTKLNEFLLSIQTLNARAMVLIDEAQNIPVLTLEQIRILSNLETEKKKLLQIVLVGQSELKEVLARPQLRQLNQRLSIRCELLPLSADETGQYIEHRLRIASENKQPRVTFNQGALKVVYSYSGGTPRLINLIAERCLIAGLASEATIIDRKIAKMAVSNLELRKVKRSVNREAPTEEGFPRSARIAIAAIGVAVLSVLILWAVSAGIFAH